MPQGRITEVINRISLTNAELSAVQEGLHILANTLEYNRDQPASIVGPLWATKLSAAQLRDLAQRLETGVDA